MAMLLEVCVDTIGDARRAAAAGAERIELCAALSEGGLTPSLGLMRASKATSIPIAAMIRPRGGDFHYSEAELALMLDDIHAAREIGTEAVVFGALSRDMTLDLAAMRALMAAAGPMSATLHRAFDYTADPFTALEEAIDLGFDRILTSGQAPSAEQGLALITALAQRAQGRISIMPGAGINAENAGRFAALGLLSEIHASCSSPVAEAEEPLNMGQEGAAPRRETNAAKVEALRRALDHAAS